MNQEIPFWLSDYWFKKETFQSFTYENPEYLGFLYFLPLLLIVPILYSLLDGRRFKLATFDRKIRGDWFSILRFVAPIVFTGVVALCLVALARPQRSNERLEQYTRGIDIMLTIDISRSMELTDLKPNRLEATKRVARDFIQSRKGDRIGLTIFSGDAYSLCPLTTDHTLLLEYIENLEFEMIQAQGTAIGSALGVSVNRMRETNSPSRVIVLLSDGENNAGNLDPLSVAQMAQAYGIRIYTIAVGLEGQIPMGTDPFGRTQYVKSSIDLPLLKQIAVTGNGKFYRATNNKTLKKVFREIDTLEKSEIVENRYKNTTDYYHIYLYWALFLLGVYYFFKLPLFSNVLTD